MKTVKMKANQNDWQYEQEVKQHKKQHKQFRKQRANRKDIWSNYSE